MRRLIGVFVFCIFAGQNLIAQNIKRKGSLGVNYYQNIPDSVAKRLNYKSGAIVISALPNTTAAAIGLQKDDIILKMNDAVISKPSLLSTEAKKLRANESIKVQLLRGGKEIQLQGTIVERPRETSPTADVIYGEFAYKSGYVRTILKTPKNSKPLGTIYFLQGLPCYSLDNMQPLDKTKQAIDAMVERGFAVYRMEKGDMGDNVGFGPCEEMGYREELEMYKAGYENLLKLEGIDKDKIYLFGHSMGGTTAPLLAEKYQPRGVVVYGTGFRPWAEYLCEAFLIQLTLRGEDLGELRDALEQYKPYFYEFFYGKKPVEEIVKDPLGMQAMQHLLNYNPMTKLGPSGRSMSTFKELNEFNVAKALSAYQNYVLAIYGECDLNANSPDDNIALIKHVNSQHPGKGTFWLAEKTTHTFEKIGTMAEFIEWQKNPQAYAQYAATRFNPEVFDYACNWMKETLQKPIEKAINPIFEDASNNLPDDGAKGPSMDVQAADIDDDGDLDIVLANEFKANTILINDGKAKFTDESVNRLPQVVHDSEDVVIKDFDQDGKLDLIFCSEDDKEHELYLNKGKGYFMKAENQLPDSEANAVVSVDLNGDKKQDLIFGNNGQNVVYINQGKAVFKADETRLPKATRVTQDLALADIDNDGDLDLLAGNEDGNLLYRNNGKGFFEDISSTNLPKIENLETRKVTFGDVDHDGDMDVFLSNVNFRGNKNAQNRLFINDGKGKFTDETDQRLPKDTDHTIDAIFEDLNADGHIDIVVANVFGSYLKAYINDGKGNFTDETIKIFGKKYVRDALGVIAADLNGDGKKDLYICDRYNPAQDQKDLLLIRK
ncbi:MAG: FG-GAP-like repeat-containing protein [Spirosomataceae bacterium]